MKSILLLFAIMLAACASDVVSVMPDAEKPAKRLLYPYQLSAQCKGCHTDQYQQHSESMHSKAFTNPFFNLQYFNEVVPQAKLNPTLIPDARKCIACHAPIVFMNYTGLVSTPEEAERFETGVTCDFCHTFGGYAENGDYLQVTSGRKQGPFQTRGASSHHSEYSGFVEVGEFCGGCHNSNMHTGAKLKSTYSEWLESNYSKQRVTCQQCHMNKNGFLRGGISDYEQGEAAFVNVGFMEVKQERHEKLYNHSFPGAHSANQLIDAVPLDIQTDLAPPDSDGRFNFKLIVNNERSGHKMPSGSSDLRFMWLEVTAVAADGRKFPVALKQEITAEENDYSIAGSSRGDAEILQSDVPTGSRLYRAVMTNSSGRQSLFQSDVVKNDFDNRLNASEIRTEIYTLQLPEGFSGEINLEARLYYRRSPSSFAKRLRIKDYGSVLIASFKKQTFINLSDVLQK
ncbi:MAG: multiheme c-type cytochrome [Desulfuromonadaceae bacterium]|nr:multiheme c-type cytochrome [Desulfuromonadaceae bacterium]MDD2855066.1 multiheme c-type cytochrome [Desulfuromonadaceae bacterium]